MSKNPLHKPFKNLLTNIYIVLMGRVFVTGLGDRSSIPGRVIPKAQKMVADAGLLNTQHHKVRIQSGAIQGKE